MISEGQMRDIKKRMAERKKEWKKQISGVLDKDKYSWGTRPLVPNRDAQDKKAMERKILNTINSVRPKNTTIPRLKEKKVSKSAYRASRPMKVMEV